MTWIIEFAPAAEKLLARMDTATERRVLTFLRKRVASHPDPKQLAEPLRGQWRGYYRFRIGDYRVICQFHDNTMVLLVVTLGHRRDIYH